MELHQQVEPALPITPVKYSFPKDIKSCVWNTLLLLIENVPEERTFLDSVELFNVLNNLVIDKKLSIGVEVFDETGQPSAQNLIASELIERRNRPNRIGTSTNRLEF